MPAGFCYSSSDDVEHVSLPEMAGRIEAGGYEACKYREGEESTTVSEVWMFIVGHLDDSGLSPKSSGTIISLGLQRRVLTVSILL